MAVAVIRFLSFFTIQVNILIVVCMLLPAFTPSSRVCEFVSRSSFRTAVMSYSTAVMSYSAVMAIIYFVVLRNIGHDQGLERFADQVLHYVTPTMFFVDWLVWVPKGHARWSAIGSYLIYPAFYCGWTCQQLTPTLWTPSHHYSLSASARSRPAAETVMLEAQRMEADEQRFAERRNSRQSRRETDHRFKTAVFHHAVLLRDSASRSTMRSAAITASTSFDMKTP
jgi:hypothetical protein